MLTQHYSCPICVRVPSRGDVRILLFTDFVSAECVGGLGFATRKTTRYARLTRTGQPRRQGGHVTPCRVTCHTHTHTTYVTSSFTAHILCVSEFIGYKRNRPIALARCRSPRPPSRMSRDTQAAFDWLRRLVTSTAVHLKMKQCPCVDDRFLRGAVRRVSFCRAGRSERRREVGGPQWRWHNSSLASRLGLLAEPGPDVLHRWEG